MRCWILFFCSVSLLTPYGVRAAVSITEIMYDLEGSDTDREWVEIFNSGGDAVQLTGWKLHEADTNHSLTVVSGSASLSAGGYAVIVDNAEKFLADWPGFSSVLFDSSFSLSNTGETLVLKDPSLVALDTVTYQSTTGAAGDGNSLQLVSGSWGAGVPTPGAANRLSPPPAGGGAGATSTPPANTSGSSSSSSGSSAPAGGGVTPSLTVSISAPSAALAGAPVELRGSVYGLEGKRIPNARLQWNFGDGGIGNGETVLHTYHVPGRYVVILDASSGEYAGSERHIVEVVPPEISFLEVRGGADGFVRIKNDGSVELDLSGWILRSGGGEFIFLPHSIILGNSTGAFSATMVGFPFDLSDTRLYFPTGVEATRYAPLPPVPVRGSSLSPPARIPTTPTVPASEVRSTEDEDRVTPVSENNSSSSVAAVSLSSESGGDASAIWILGVLALVGGGVVAVRAFRRHEAGEHTSAPGGLKAEDFTIIEE